MPATITHWHGGEGGERNYIKLQISVFFVWITMQILDVLTYLAVLEVRGRSVSHCVDNGSHSSHWPLVSHYSGKTETQQTAHCQPAGASRHHLSCLPRRQSTRRHRGQAWPGRPLIGQQWRHVWPSQAVHCPPAQPLQHMQGAVTLVTLATFTTNWDRRGRRDRRDRRQWRNLFAAPATIGHNTSVSTWNIIPVLGFSLYCSQLSDY